MRELHPGAQRHLPEVRHLRQHNRVLVSWGLGLFRMGELRCVSTG